METPTLETGTISTKSADVLEARLLVEDHSFIQQSFIEHFSGTRLDQGDEWRTK